LYGIGLLSHLPGDADRVRSEEEPERPAFELRLGVEAEQEAVAGGQRVRRFARRPGLEDLPLEPTLPHPPAHLEGHHHPFLVRRQRHGERPDRHGRETLSVPRFRVAARFAVGVDLDGALDGNAVPVGDESAGLEHRVLAAGLDLGDDVPRRFVLEVLLHAERQVGGPGAQRLRQDVGGVEIPQAGEDRDQLGVEGRVGQAGGVTLEQPETLERIDRVHCTLQGEVDVNVLDERQRLVNEELTFRGAQQ
jgi:hypothetical protein